MSQQTLDSGLGGEDGDEDGAECPTCGEAFGSEHGMKIHHNKTHGESIAGVKYECDYCGETERKKKSEYEARGHNFCSMECMGAFRTENGTVEYECDYCGVNGQRIKCEYNEDSHNFCSVECVTSFQSAEGSVEFECDRCGETVRRANSHYGRGKRSVCSAECWGKLISDKVEYECENCGKTGRRARSRYEAGEHNFCSHYCRAKYYSREDNPNWKEDTVARDYGENWAHAKDYVRQRDGGVCQLCESERDGRAFAIHHIVKVRLFDRWSEMYDCVSVEDSNVPRNLVTLCYECHPRVDFGDAESPVPESHWRAE
jgi:5-methylcytosine-specific restriction endonuclease McrA